MKRHEGKIQQFDSDSGEGKVLVGERLLDFHGTDYSADTARAPAPNDTVDVILADQRLIRVRARG